MRARHPRAEDPDDADDRENLRALAVAQDSADPLRRFRRRFVITDPELIYLDGNSLGRLPVATRQRLRGVISQEWGGELIRGWDHWITLAGQAGDIIATLIGANPGEVVVSDSTTVNLYKLAAAALDAAQASSPGTTGTPGVSGTTGTRGAAPPAAAVGPSVRGRRRGTRRVIVTDDDNFPTDLYVLQGLAAARGGELRIIKTDLDVGVSAEAVAAAVDTSTALVSLSHVAYRSGAVADMPAITAAAHRVGAMMLWDLSHSVGSVPVPLHDSQADLAVGCTYKYLNGGPGAPAFLYVRADLQPLLRQPIWGWFGQRDQFGMAADYEPMEGIDRFLVGTPSVLGVIGALEGARLAAEAGITEIATKARALTSYAVQLTDAWLAPLGFRLTSPRDPLRRGGHICLYHPHAWQVCQALRHAGVIPDFRTPDRLRLAFAPLYTRFVDVHDGLARLRDVVTSGAHLPHPTALSRVT